MRLRTLVLGAVVLTFFVAWTAATARPVFVTYHSKYSIFSRNYARHGLLGTRLLTYYNFELTDPPSTPYLSGTPLVPLIMYAASTLAGDRPPTYQGVMVVLHVIAFVLLAYFVLRRWGESAALWTLVVAVFSGYALTYADQQSPGILGIGAAVAVVFLYFDWIERRQRRAFALCFVAYLVCLAADYRSVVTAAAIGTHWFFVVRGRVAGDWLKMLLLPAATLVAWGLMLFLMWHAGAPLDLVLRRAEARSSARIGADALRAFTHYPLALFGPVMLPAALAFVGFLGLHPRTRREFTDTHTLPLLGCLAAPGLVLVVFGQVLVDHAFMLASVLPVFAVSAGLGISLVLRRVRSPGLRGLCAVGLAGAALASALHGNARTAMLQQRWGSVAKPPSRFERVRVLAHRIKPGLRDGDRLLILKGHGSASLEKVTVFHALWIPCVDAGGPARWNGHVSSGRYRLALATDPDSYRWLSSRPDVRVLAADGPFVFFEASAPSPADRRSP